MSQAELCELPVGISNGKIRSKCIKQKGHKSDFHEDFDGFRSRIVIQCARRDLHEEHLYASDLLLITTDRYYCPGNDGTKP